MGTSTSYQWYPRREKQWKVMETRESAKDMGEHNEYIYSSIVEE